MCVYFFYFRVPSIIGVIALCCFHHLSITLFLWSSHFLSVCWFCFKPLQMTTYDLRILCCLALVSFFNSCHLTVMFPLLAYTFWYTYLYFLSKLNGLTLPSNIIGACCHLWQRSSHKLSSITNFAQNMPLEDLWYISVFCRLEHSIYDWSQLVWILSRMEENVFWC